MKKLSVMIALLCALSFISFGASKGSPNLHCGYEYVDLGLSVKWATCNVGANTPLDYGDYYAWGETSSKDVYSAESYTHEEMLPYNIGGNKKYDVAADDWGGRWRMPSSAEWEELIENCTWTWTNITGYKGYLVTSKINGNGIFLPAAGWLESGDSDREEKFGNYWSSSLESDEELIAVGLGFHEDDVYIFQDDCFAGRSIRPVLGNVKYNSVDMGLSVDWATCNIGAVTPWEAGDYFAWGETAPKLSYFESNSATHGKILEDIGGSEIYDAAVINCGLGWRLPTKEEFQELIDNCDWTWAEHNDHTGYFVTSRINGNTIFFPVTGWKEDGGHGNPETHGVYWSSSVHEDSDYSNKAYGMAFYMDNIYRFLDIRYSGLCIRPVREK